MRENEPDTIHNLTLIGNLFPSISINLANSSRRHGRIWHFRTCPRPPAATQNPRPSYASRPDRRPTYRPKRPASCRIPVSAPRPGCIPCARAHGQNSIPFASSRPSRAFGTPSEQGCSLFNCIKKERRDCQREWDCQRECRCAKENSY